MIQIKGIHVPIYHTCAASRANQVTVADAVFKLYSICISVLYYANQVALADALLKQVAVFMQNDLRQSLTDALVKQNAVVMQNDLWQTLTNALIMQAVLLRQNSLGQRLTDALIKQDAVIMQHGLRHHACVIRLSAGCSNVPPSAPYTPVRS